MNPSLKSGAYDLVIDDNVYSVWCHFVDGKASAMLLHSANSESKSSSNELSKKSGKIRNKDHRAQKPELIKPASVWIDVIVAVVIFCLAIGFILVRVHQEAEPDLASAATFHVCFWTLSFIIVCGVSDFSFWGRMFVSFLLTAVLLVVMGYVVFGRGK